MNINDDKLDKIADLARNILQTYIDDIFIISEEVINPNVYFYIKLNEEVTIKKKM